MMDEWEPLRFDAELDTMDRVVVLYHADWCPFSRAFLPHFEAAEPESSVPFVTANLRHPLDARWDDHRIRVVPTAAYYEKGEELERVEAERGEGMDETEFERFLDMVETLQEDPMRRPWKRRVGR